MKKLVGLVILVVLALPTIAGAGVIADAYAKKRPVVYQTELYALPLYVEGKTVAVDRCVDGLRVWYTRSEKQRDDMKDSRIRRLRTAMDKYYPVAEIAVDSPGSCVDAPAANRVRFTHLGRPGDPLFYDAVERALDELGMGAVIACPGASRQSCEWIADYKARVKAKPHFAGFRDCVSQGGDDVCEKWVNRPEMNIK